MIEKNHLFWQNLEASEQVIGSFEEWQKFGDRKNFASFVCHAYSTLIVDRFSTYTNNKSPSAGKVRQIESAARAADRLNDKWTRFARSLYST